jgi:hypothetical protein
MHRLHQSFKHLKPPNHPRCTRRLLRSITLATGIPESCAVLHNSRLSFDSRSGYSPECTAMQSRGYESPPQSMPLETVYASRQRESSRRATAAAIKIKMACLFAGGPQGPGVANWGRGHCNFGGNPTPGRVQRDTYFASPGAGFCLQAITCKVGAEILSRFGPELPVFICATGTGLDVPTAFASEPFLSRLHSPGDRRPEYRRSTT